MQSSQDSIEFILQTANSLQTDYQLINFYLQQKDAANAEQLFYQIPNKYEFTNLQAVEYEKMAEIIDLQVALIIENRNIQELTEQETEMLYELSADSLHKAGGIARSILTINGSEEFSCGIIIPVLEESPDFATPPAQPELKFNLTPNPAKDYFVTDYELPVSDFRKANFSMYNSENVKVYRQAVTNRVYQLLIETGGFVPGYYNCKLSADGTEYAQKIVAIKPDQITAEQREQAEKIKKEMKLHLVSDRLVIFPNPAKDFVIVRYNFEKSSKQNGRVLLTDNAGKIVRIKNLTSNIGQQSVSVSGLPVGMYTISISFGQQIETAKFVVSDK